MNNSYIIKKENIGNIENTNKKICEVEELFNQIFTNYEAKEMFLSFNGGKDCTVLLDLIQSFLKEKNISKYHKIRTIYIQSNNQFQEVDDFVNLCENTYNIVIDKRRGKLKNVLKQICLENTELKAVIMGCRRTDPYCKDLKTMQKTDADWPPLMRINPLLDWTCKDIWNYILSRDISYCNLYDCGYTSLGDQTNTKQNPHLKVVECTNSSECQFRPAYELTDDHLERSGRS